jgi:hypothetical protein
MAGARTAVYAPRAYCGVNRSLRLGWMEPTTDMSGVIFPRIPWLMQRTRKADQRQMTIVGTLFVVP